MPKSANLEQNIHSISLKKERAYYPETDGKCRPAAQCLFAPSYRRTHPEKIPCSFSVISSCYDRFFSIAKQCLRYMPVQSTCGNILRIDFRKNKARIFQGIMQSYHIFQIFLCSRPPVSCVKIENKRRPMATAEMHCPSA